MVFFLLRSRLKSPYNNSYWFWFEEVEEGRDTSKSRKKNSAVYSAIAINVVTWKSRYCKAMLHAGWD